MELTFVADDLPTLLLLQRTILEARFHSAAPGPEIPGSPLVAELHERVIVAIGNHYASAGDAASAARLETWLEWKRRSAEHVSLARTLRSMPGWSSLERERQSDIARSLMTPFRFADEDVQKLLAAAERQ